MTVSVAGDSFARAMCDALGLKRATKIVLTMEVGFATTVDATFYPDREALEPVLRQFHLNPQPAGEQSQQSADVLIQRPEQLGDLAI